MSSAALFPTLSDNRRWQLVLARDARYDGTFVYAVRSTGIYCRPSCPSRRPKRDHVSFFPTAKQAERAGFRVCRRCGAKSGRDESQQAELVRQVCRLIDADSNGAGNVRALAAACGATPSRIARAFRDVLGLTPRQYRDQRRLARFKAHLKVTNTVSPAVYEAGYSSPSRVYEDVHARLGMTPATYSRGGKGAHIRYATGTSPVGRVLVAATEHGICRIAMSDTDAWLERELRAEFPAAAIARETAAGPLHKVVAALIASIETGASCALSIPLDVRATAFQRLVWNALRKIPAGSTKSYTAVARAIGKPTAARAVARACATNPVALLVPCHRVVRESGEMSGYRWGLERKRALLEREGAM